MSGADEQPRAGVEAARLLSAAQEWLRTSAPHLAPVDGEGQTCPCPLCRAVAGVREADPDAVGRWVDSAVAAATALLAQAGERAGAAAAAASGTGDAGAEGSEGGAGPAYDDGLGDDDDHGDDDLDDEDDGTDEDVDDDGADDARGVRRIPLVLGEDEDGGA